MVLNGPVERCFWISPSHLTLFVTVIQHMAAAQQSILPLCQTPRWLLTFLHRGPAWIGANPSCIRVSPRDRRLPHSTPSIAASPQRREEVVCPASGGRLLFTAPPAYHAGGRRHRTFRRKAVTNVTGGGLWLWDQWREALKPSEKTLWYRWLSIGLVSFTPLMKVDCISCILGKFIGYFNAYKMLNGIF